MAGDLCSSCSAPITWIRSAASGQWLPLDRDPVPAGNVTINAAGLAVVHSTLPAAPSAQLGLGLVDLEPAADLEPAGTGPRFTAHHATCPRAGDHRRSR